MRKSQSACIDVYELCVEAILRGELIESPSSKDKEFHFQNWFSDRLSSASLNFDAPGRNTYPDFRLVDFPEGFEIKALAYPGRQRDYDCNSQVPSGDHDGRRIFYVFGRYPADTSEHVQNDRGQSRYPVVDLVICHGAFLNADRNYVHKNRNAKGFGTYGDIMIRDRKMYVARTPFALTEGTTGVQTLILPAEFPVDHRLRCVGKLVRREASDLVVGYGFDLRTNTIRVEKVRNPNAGMTHEFRAYRLVSQKAVATVTLVPADIEIEAGSEDGE